MASICTAHSRSGCSSLGPEGPSARSRFLHLVMRYPGIREGELPPVMSAAVRPVLLATVANGTQSQSD